MKNLVVDAKEELLDEVIEFIVSDLEEADCPMPIEMKIRLSVEELFVNIAKYAYSDRSEGGKAEIQIEIVPDPRKVMITFIDSGIEYNPLAKTDPDVTLKVEDREIGGLGIFLVKKCMDDVRYEYKDGKNVLTIEKSF